MRADCEVVIARAGFLGVLEGTQETLTLMAPDVVSLAPTRQGLRITTAAAMADLPAEGRWAKSIEVPLALLRGIVAKCEGPTILLVYTGNALIIDRTIIEAREGHSPYQILDFGNDKQLCLMETRIDLNWLAQRPMRSRRRQCPAVRAPLLDCIPSIVASKDYPRSKRNE